MLHRVICAELLPAQPVLWVQPETQRLGVQVHHLAHVSPQQRQILHEFVDVVFLIYYTIAVLLGEDVLDFAGGVDQTHHQLHVAGYPSGKDDRFALLGEIGQKVIQVFAFVDVEEGLVLLKPKMEIFLPARAHHVAFLIGRKGEGKHFVHFHDHGDFVWVGGRGQQFGSVDVFIQDGCGEVGLVGGLPIEGHGRGGRGLFGEEGMGQVVENPLAHAHT